jgi:hypothetical protein
MSNQNNRDSFFIKYVWSGMVSDLSSFLLSVNMVSTAAIAWMIILKHKEDTAAINSYTLELLGTSFSKCGKCKKTRYCSKSCQASD